MDEMRNTQQRPGWPGVAPQAAPAAASGTAAKAERLLAAALEPPELFLDGHGIVGCNAAAARLFGYARMAMVGLPVGQLLPILASFDLSRSDAIDPALAFLCHSGITFAASRGDGTTFRCQLTIVRYGNSGPGTVRLIVHTVDDPAAAVG